MNSNQKLAHEITYRLVDAGAADQKVMDDCENWVLERLNAQPVSQRYKFPELNEELINILGRPNFTCSYAAMVLRKGGMEIKRKSEHEQAAVIHFLLGHYLKHGDKWFVEADKELIEMAAASAEVK